MLSQNPNATPIWMLMIFSAPAVFGYPQVKKFVAKHVAGEEKQNFFSLITMLVVGAVVVTLSVIFFP